jgi:hypothetical protein
MTLTPGTRLGPYEIVAPIGAGGMGEVYKARDTRLDRLVAIKILSGGTSASPDARERFEREARAISQLSHPHICAVHDVGSHDGLEYLVMELLDGETLSARLDKGALSIELTYRYGAAIARALDAAHQRGVIHRDLKPANVMIAKSGVKLLDFGLAKTLAAPAHQATAIATASGRDLTDDGTTLGTLRYMSPEQIEGRQADVRSDIFALGSVIFEMATGRKAFPGANTAAIASAILRDEPPAIAASPALDRLVHICLAKDPEDRWQTARDVQLQLSSLPASGAIASRGVARRGRRWFGSLPWLVTALAVLVAGVSLLRGRLETGPTPSPVVRFPVPPPSGGAFWDNFENVPLAMAPDGTQLAFIAADASRVQRVWVRPMSVVDPRPVPGTERASAVIWSPDSRSIAFFAEGKVKRIDLPDGAAVTLCEFESSPGLSATWGRGGQILMARVGGDAIYRLPASGGTPEIELKPDASKSELRSVFPWYLPDGRRFLYSARLRGDARVMLAEPGKPPRQLLSVVSHVQYVEPGYLVFVREGTLVAQRVDLDRAALVGAPISIAGPVRYFFSTAASRFATSLNGAVVYHAAFDQNRLGGPFRPRNRGCRAAGHVHHNANRS